MKILHLRKNMATRPVIMSSIVFLSATLCNPAVAQVTGNLLMADTTSAVERKLVELAWQGPEVEKTAHQTKIDEYQLKAAQNVWMNLLALNMNFNEYNLAPSTTATYVYPRYNVGVSIPLGTIFSRTAVKAARENIEIGKDNVEIIKRNIRQQVLTAYKQYMAYDELIAMQSEMVSDVKTQLAQAEEKFRSGTISLDAYNSAQRNNKAELAALVDLKLQQDLKKLELEKLIGVKLETVIKK